MQARDVINQLIKMEKNEVIRVPFQVFGDTEFPRDIFLHYVGKLLIQLQPKMLVIDCWPNKKIESNAVSELLAYLSEHGVTKIQFDFSKQNDIWIQLFFDAAQSCYPLLKIKPELRCVQPVLTSPYWDEKFWLLSQPKILTPKVVRPTATSPSYLQFLNSMNPQHDKGNKTDKDENALPIMR